MRLPRLQVKVFKNIVDVIPILHEQGISLVDYYDFNRRQEVMVTFLCTALS
jgi:hypothetical protein